MIFGKGKKFKEVEKELIKTREDLDNLNLYLKQITSFLPVAVCIITRVNVFLDVNTSFENLSGYSASEIIGKPVETIFEDKEGLIDLIKSIKKKGEIGSKEGVVVTPKNKKIPVKVFCGQRKDNQNDITGYFLTIIDISETKEFQDKLEQTVEEKTKELRKRLNELEIFNRMTVGREITMIDLKKDIKKLKEELQKVQEEKKK
jgi:PAS domain S-box-containing protein